MKQSTSHLLRLIACCGLALLWSRPMAHAQVSSAEIGGTVSDSSGASLQGATVLLVNQGTGATRSTVTKQSGDFVVPALEPGKYRITVEAAGFSEAVADHVMLNVGDRKTLNFSLKIGAATQTVTVASSGELINATSADISAVINEDEVKDLPLNGRDPSSLVLLTTGVSNALNTNAGWLQASIPTETVASAGGGRQGSTYYLLDGVPNMDTYLLSAAPFPNADATQEFRVISNNYGAQYGFAPSAVVSIQTKSGTDSFHGVLFEFLRNNDLNAGNYFTKQVDPLKRNQFGGAVGGPIIKQKLFFFANYQATRASEASSTNTTFDPTAAMLKGDFSAIQTPLSTASYGPEYFYTNAMGVHNQIDPSHFSKGGVALASVIPVGQDPVSGQVNYVGPEYKISYDEGTGRLDYAISAKQHAVLRNFFVNYSSPSVTIPGNILALALNPAGQSGKAYSELFGHTWTISSSMVNVFEGSWTRLDSGAGGVVEDAAGKPFCLATYIKIAAPPDGCYIDGMWDATQGIYTPWALPYTYHRVSWGLTDSINKTVSAHLITAGVDAYHQFAHENSTWPAYPNVGFGDYTGNAIADFLLGNVNYFLQGGGQVNVENGWVLGVYGQDQYRASQSLTVTAGLRWEPNLPPAIAGGHASAFIPGEQSQLFPGAPNGLVFIGDKGVQPALMSNDYATFEPRVGFAFQPRTMPKTAFRAGFGMFTAPLQYSEYAPFGDVPPWDPFYELDATATSPIPLDNPWSVYGFTGGTSPFPPFVSPNLVAPSNFKFLTPVTLKGTLSRDFKLGVTQSWNASVEQELPWQMALHVAYVGSESYHQATPLDLNPGIYANNGARTTYGPPNGGMGPILESMIAGTASYNSLQASLNKHLANGLQFQTSFTWSKDIDLFSVGSLAQATELPNPFDIRWNRGISNLNFPFISITNFIYETPALAHSGILLKNVLGLWQLSGIWTTQSGTSFGVVGGNGNDNSESLQYGDRADVVPGQPYQVRQGGKSHWLNQYFNPAAFTANQPGTFGNSGRNLLEGPPINSADIGIDKNWRIQEKCAIQFRWEMFNAFNHPSFANPNSDPTSGYTGKITSIGVIPPRVMQGALKLSF
jgi:Carboxypeptidase regulatory-like domain